MTHGPIGKSLAGKKNSLIEFVCCSRWLSARRPTEEHFAYLKEEIELCEIIAERYPRNYHAWSYRHWIWLQITGMNKHKSAQQTLIKEEMEMMNIWCKSHLMDGSGWNHRALLVSSALKIEWVANIMKKSAEMILSAEYEYISQLLSAYPKHEALWYHRRFVIQQYLAFAFRKETHTTSCFETLICDTSKILIESICNIRKASGASESLQLAWDSLHFHTTHNICKSTVQTVVTEIETALRFSADVTGSNLFAKQFALWLLEFCASKCTRPDKISKIVKGLRFDMNEWSQNDEILLKYLFIAKA